MGFIPFLIFGVNIALFTGSVDINAVVETLRIYLTPQSMEVLEEHIEHIVEQTNDIWMFAGLFVSAYSFENGLAILVRATDNETYARRVKKSFLEMTPEKICVHIKSVLYALGLVLVVVVSNILAIFGNSVVGWIGSKFALPTAFLGALNLAIYIIPFVVLIIGLTLFYLFAPYSYTPPISDAFFAAFFVTVLWFVLTVFYRLALMLIPGMGMSYGPVFGLFIMFFWLQYIVAIIIVGLGLIQGNTINFQNKLDASRGKENE